MKNFTDKTLQILLGRALQAGIIISISLILLGGIIYLVQNGERHFNYEYFTAKISISSILRGLSHFESKSIIYLGIVFLIATPVLRVALSALGFVMEKDILYTAITVVVLLIILYSVLNGHPA